MSPSTGAVSLESRRRRLCPEPPGVFCFIHPHVFWEIAMRRLRLLLPLLGALAALGVAGVQAATSATQNLTFSVPAVVSIASNGNVAAGSLTGSTTVTGSFTIGSN